MMTTLFGIDLIADFTLEVLSSVAWDLPIILLTVATLYHLTKKPTSCRKTSGSKLQAARVQHQRMPPPNAQKHEFEKGLDNDGHCEKLSSTARLHQQKASTYESDVVVLGSALLDAPWKKRPSPEGVPSSQASTTDSDNEQTDSCEEKVQLVHKPSGPWNDEANYNARRFLREMTRKSKYNHAHIAKQVQLLLESSNIALTFPTYLALIDIYIQGGNLKDAIGVMNQMEEKGHKLPQQQLDGMLDLYVTTDELEAGNSPTARSAFQDELVEALTQHPWYCIYRNSLQNQTVFPSDDKLYCIIMSTEISNQCQPPKFMTRELFWHEDGKTLMWGKASTLACTLEQVRSGSVHWNLGDLPGCLRWSATDPTVGI